MEVQVIYLDPHLRRESIERVTECTDDFGELCEIVQLEMFTEGYSIAVIQLPNDDFCTIYDKRIYGGNE